MSSSVLPAAAADDERCAAEPIHLPGGIQPHGALLVFEPRRFEVVQASANAAGLLGVDPFAPGDAFGPLIELLREAVVSGESGASGAGALDAVVGERRFHLGVHPGDQGIVAEFEPASQTDTDAVNALHPRIRAFVDRTEGAPDAEALGRIAAAELRELTGFDRVLVYRFSPEWHGTVIAEAGSGRLPSYLGLRFPASDIPAQARELYRKNRLRLIPDAGYRPVPIVPATSPLDGRPLDLSAASLRSVAAVHVEYMRNMGTAASMSISILIDGALWGLVACHHAEPRVLGPQWRATCSFIGQILSLQIGARERSAGADARLALAGVERELLARVSRAPSIPSGLADSPEAWLALTRASGAAVVMDGVVLTAGRAPSPEQVTALAAWVAQRRDAEPVFATRELAAEYPPAAEFVDTAAGLLSVSISTLHPNAILWFRPELVHTVTWGGAPTKLEDEDGKLHPRRSFQRWSEEVRGRSEPWTHAEVETAGTFMSAVVSFVLKRAEERAELTDKLESSNRELEAFSYSVSHDLRAPFRHVIGYAQLLREADDRLDDRSRRYLGSIIDAAAAAGRLVDDLLHFSQLGRSTLALSPIDMTKLVSEIRRSSEIAQPARSVEWRIGRLPVGYGDPSLIRQALGHLVDNALKYSRDREPAIVEVSGENRVHETVYTVRDNGVGFEMAFADKLFGVFQRLHRVEEFEGTGIGLALTRRIVDRHGGWIAAEGELNRGAVLRFGLPKEPA